MVAKALYISWLVIQGTNTIIIPDRCRDIDAKLHAIEFARNQSGYQGDDIFANVLAKKFNALQCENKRAPIGEMEPESIAQYTADAESYCPQISNFLLNSDNYTCNKLTDSFRSCMEDEILLRNIKMQADRLHCTKMNSQEEYDAAVQKTKEIKAQGQGNSWNCKPQGYEKIDCKLKDSPWHNL